MRKQSTATVTKFYRVQYSQMVRVTRPSRMRPNDNNLGGYMVRSGYKVVIDDIGYPPVIWFPDW